MQPHVPAALEEIVHRALARDMDKRFPDVKSLLEALEDLIHVDVTYAPNKMSTGHSGRLLLSGTERERVDVSYIGPPGPPPADR